MTLEERIQSDIKTAQKAAAADRLALLRLLHAALQGRQIEKRGKGGEAVLSDEEVLQVVQREAKKRREAIELYTKGGRPELAKQEEAELLIINEYLPTMMGADEIQKIVATVRAGGATEYAAVMKEVMARVRGQADGKLVSDIVKASLEG